MARILDENMVLVLGNGIRVPAHDKAYVYEHQEEDEGTQPVRVWRDTAVEPARLWVKGINRSTPFDRHLWFSDTYVRMRNGWRYCLGQAALHLPDPTSAP